VISTPQFATVDETPEAVVTLTALLDELEKVNPGGALDIIDWYQCERNETCSTDAECEALVWSYCEKVAKLLTGMEVRVTQ
jgi:hypothetical protein